MTGPADLPLVPASGRCSGTGHVVWVWPPCGQWLRDPVFHDLRYLDLSWLVWNQLTPVSSATLPSSLDTLMHYMGSNANNDILLRFRDERLPGVRPADMIEDR